MSIHKGIYGSVNVATNRVAEVKSWDFEESAQEEDATTMNDAGNKSYDAGAIETSGNISCLYDPTDTAGQVALAIGATVALELYPVISATGAKYWGGNAKIMSVKRTVGVDGLVTADFSFKVNGGLTLQTEA